MALNITINKVAVADSFAVGTKVADIVVSGGTSPYSYSLASGGDYFQISGTEVQVINEMDISNIQSFSVTATDSTSGTALTITSEETYPNLTAEIQNRFNSANKIYKITRDIDLGHGILTIPSGCTLDFQGGSFSNGTIQGNGTDIKETNKSLIFKDIIISGSWKVSNIYSNWFEFNQVSTSNSLLNLLNLCNLSTDNFTGTIIIDKGNYYISILNRSTDFIAPYNNTTIILNGTITVNANSHDTYHVFRIALKNNITIKGKGTLVGDVETHLTETGESGMGISLYSANNITIKGLTITKFWGDGVYIGLVIQSNTDYGTNILIEDLDLTYNRRQGISITAGENITIKNCRITDTGGIKVTEPGAGIDIEPNYSNQVVRNINIEGCYFARNNKTNNGDLLVTGMLKDNTANENFSCTVNNCYFSGTVRLTSSIGRMTITSSYIGNFIPEYTGSHYYWVMVSGCLINNSAVSLATNPGLYISGCSYLNENGTTLDRVFSGNTTGSTPYIKIKFTKFDGIAKMTLFSKYINSDNYTCSEVILKSRWIATNDEKFFKKVHTNIYDHSLLGSINLDTLYEHCLLVSLPILDTDNPNFWYVYVKDPRITRYDYTIKLENVLNSVYDMPFFTGVTVETITELPEELDFKDSFSLFIYGSTSAITEHLIASIGTTVYDTTLNKMKVWNGSTWVNMDGTALE